MGKKKKNIRKSRQNWWKSLSADKQNEYIAKLMRSKKEKRLQRSVDLANRFRFDYNCNECIHKKTRSCTDYLPHGCEYFYDVINKIKGLAYLNYEEPELPFEQQKHLNDIMRVQKG